MSVINLIIILVIIGVILWLVNTYVPMDAKIKQILNIAIVIIVVLWLLQLFIGPVADIRVGPVR